MGRLKKFLIIFAMFFTLPAIAVPLRPCYHCTRPRPVVNYHYHYDNSDRHTIKALATTAVALSVIAILIELQPSRVAGQVRIAEF